jgi:hypothetical protein
MLCVCGASALVSPARAEAQEASASQASPQPAAPPAAAPPADRLTLTANGSTLSTSDSGRGASVGWLHYLSGQALIGLAVEHQSVADADWSFASFSGALSRTRANGRLINFHGEVQRGSGEEAGRAFTHSVTAVGVTGAVTQRLWLRFESRQIDIDRTEGNLPALGLTFQWNAHFLTDVAYERSVSGNLGTELVLTRTDYFGKRFRLLFGAASGEAAPSVVNLQPGLSVPGANSLREVFAGASKTLGRGELLGVADHLDMSASQRTTLTISYAIPLRARGNR